MKKFFIIFILVYSFFSANNTGAMPPPPRCEQFTYSNCPSYGCEKTCKPSACSGNICTADCDGPGSCHLPVAKSCIKLGERFKFYTENQFCCDGLTKAPGKDTKNIIPGYSTCIKIDRFCDSKYENSWNSPLDCKKDSFKVIGGSLELLNNKYNVKYGDALQIKTLFNTTKINSNTIINYDTVIYNEKGLKIDYCKDKKTSLNYYRNQIKTYCELDYFKNHYPEEKKYKILTQLQIKIDGRTYFKEISNSFIIGKKEGFCGLKGETRKTYKTINDLNKSGAKFLFKGKCETKPCAMFKIMSPGPGCYRNWDIDAYGCKNPGKIICEPKIPKNCISWYDGCNNCSVSNGKIGACTKRYCIRQDTPKCLKYEEEKDENNKYINYIYQKMVNRKVSQVELNYYKKKQQYEAKKYFKNQIQDAVIKSILFDAVNGTLFISQDNIVRQNVTKEQFIKNLYSIGLNRKITEYELENWKKLLEKYEYLSKEKIFDYFLKSKEFEKYMKYNNYHYTNYSNEYSGAVGELGKLNISFNDLLPLTIKRVCAYNLTAISDGNGDKVCVKIGDGKCGNYENKYNSVDCKIGCKDYNVPSGVKKIYNSKNCVIGYDKIDSIINQNGYYECIDYPIYSYNFETKKQVTHFLPNYFAVANCKYTGIRKCGKLNMYISNDDKTVCCSGLTKVKIKGTNNFTKCVKIDNYCSEKEKDTYSSDCINKNKLKLSEKLKTRIDDIVKKFILKMNNSRMSTNQKISRLKLIISKINILKQKYKKYENVFDYLNKKLEEEIAFLLIGM